MRASRIFDNGRGDKYEVMCDFSTSTSSVGGYWIIRVWKKPKGKRKFTSLVGEDSWAYRKTEDKQQFKIREYLKEIPWSWVDMVMDDVCAEIRKLGNELYPKDE